MLLKLKDWLSKGAIVLCLCMPLSARASEFSKSASPNGRPDIIFVVGDLALGDEKKFINAALSSGNAIVVFQSPGGNLIAGIEIGKAIHLKGFATFVPDTVQCASACALAWLGGRVRYMSNTAQVGFHAVYVDKGGQAAVSSTGNALVGAYLNQLGLPTSAIVYITDASPQGMQWLNFTDAQNYGIDVRPFNLTALPTTPENSEPGFSLQIASVKKEVYEFVSATNRSDQSSLNYLQSKYRDEVNFYGKVVSKASVLNDKRAFFKKWSIRNYSTEPTSIAVSCVNETDCKADAIVNWNVSGRNLNSEGSASLSLRWVLDGQSWKISSESGRTINRKVTRLSPNETSSLNATSTSSETSSGLPAYHLDRSRTKVIALSNLSSDRDCTNGQEAGKIIKREFSKDGLKMTGIVLEEPDGSRGFVNIDVSLDKLDNATRSWVVKGLQTLLAEGRSVKLSVKLCGAAGRVMMIDAIREASALGG